MATLTETLDNLYTTTWQNMKSTVSDNIFDATPFWFWLKSHKGLEKTVGGRFITEPLRYAKSDNVKFIQKGDTVDLTDKEILTVAQFQWRYLVDSIVRFGVDDQQNRGKNQILSLMKAKLDNSKDSLIDQLETSLFGNASDDAGIGFHGLLDICPDVPGAGSTFGSLDDSVYTWWQNQAKDMTGLSIATLGHLWMSNMLNLCGNNLRQDMVDIIVCGQQAYEYYDDSLVTQQKQITNSKLGDAGFAHIVFKGIPMIWSPAAPTDAMYFLNTRFLKFHYDPQMYFDMTTWKEIPNQVNDRVAQVILAGNLVTGRRRVHGVMYDIDTK